MLKGDSQFHEILHKFSQETNETERKALEEGIWKRYGAEHTVFVLDMSGFSLLTRKYGIVHYLSMIQRMQQTVIPIVEGHNGRIVKFEADNCFAVFPNPLLAARAATTMQHAFHAANLLTSDELDIHVAIGIDYGKILLINNEDMFGDAVNRACKMGEDIGYAGEVLITKDAMDLIPNDADIQGKLIELSIGGLSTPAYSITYRSKDDGGQE
ncbi:MAG: adenylate/guanylate cyclase domain-containing protein [Anaerolineales bacterium]|nr:adenylate/guanylate cyclase domain-containing protein [Anaerolineales bacterium]WKZ39000.1 MAG: adenylate/guanylate cyclase domain-containing protein [Anaerolineales bacterium]